MKPRSSIPCPCIRVCTLDEESGFCLGCARTQAEIKGWNLAGDSEKERVLALLPARLACL